MSCGDAYFLPDYAKARDRFRAAVERANGSLEALKLDAKGPKGETLTIDIARFGAEKPKRVFVHSSGTHGVEGFSGSAIQLQWLAEGIPQLSEDSTILLVHAVNPYGMAWLRRVNENNVDLNRNFLLPGEEYAGAPELYVKLDPFLNPPSPPCRDLFYLRATGMAARYGARKFREAIAGGQYEFPKGLFFGGKRLEQGPTMLLDSMAVRLAGAERIVVIDVHTALGRFGDDRLLEDGAPENAAVNEEMRAAFGERVQPLDTRGVAFKIRGAQFNMYYRLGLRWRLYFAGQEFGTYCGMRVLEALRAENRWHHYGPGTLDHPVKARFRKMFDPDDARWRRMILERGRDAIQQGLGLAFGAGGSGGAGWNVPTVG